MLMLSKKTYKFITVLIMADFLMALFTLQPQSVLIIKLSFTKVKLTKNICYMDLHRNWSALYR